MRPKIGIEITDHKDGTTSIFLAIHGSDVELTRNDKTDIVLNDASVDLYLGGLDSRVSVVVYAFGERAALK
jgi:hypothetical protein